MKCGDNKKHIRNRMKAAGVAVGEMVYNTPDEKTWSNKNPYPVFDTDKDFVAWLSKNEGNLVPDDQRSNFEWVSEPVSDVYKFAICFDEPQDIEHVKSLLGYTMKVHMALLTGDGWGSEDVIIPVQSDDGKARLFIFNCDWTKTASDDIGARYGDRDAGLGNNSDESDYAYRGLHYAIRNGSPIRKTDRAGKGTKGTRLVEGITCNYQVAFA